MTLVVVHPILALVVELAEEVECEDGVEVDYDTQQHHRHQQLDGHNLFVQPASRSLIVRPGIHVTLDVITYHCST